MHVNYQQILTCIESKSLKFSFSLNCVPKRAKDLNFKLTRFRNLKPFLMNLNRSSTRQTRNRDTINILLTSSFRFVL